MLLEEAIAKVRAEKGIETPLSGSKNGDGWLVTHDTKEPRRGALAFYVASDGQVTIIPSRVPPHRVQAYLAERTEA